jgi:four helix bundle protein
MHDFRRLQVWQRARELFVAVDRLAKTFPRSDRGVVASQLRRSTLSIASNISEGCGKNSFKETVRFLDVAAGSVAETENHLVLATDLGYVHPKQSEALLDQVISIRRMLFRLRKNLAERSATSGGQYASPATEYSLLATGPVVQTSTSCPITSEHTAKHSTSLSGS